MPTDSEPGPKLNAKMAELCGFAMPAKCPPHYNGPFPAFVRGSGGRTYVRWKRGEGAYIWDPSHKVDDANPVVATMEKKGFKFCKLDIRPFGDKYDVTCCFHGYGNKSTKGCIAKTQTEAIAGAICCAARKTMDD